MTTFLLVYALQTSFSMVHQNRKSTYNLYNTRWDFHEMCKKNSHKKQNKKSFVKAAGDEIIDSI